MKLKEFWESDKPLAIRCLSEEQAIKFCKQSHNLGKKWSAGESYLDKTYWKYNEGELCYGNDAKFGSVLCYSEYDNFTILEFDDIDWNILFEDYKKSLMTEYTELKSRYDNLLIMLNKFDNYELDFAPASPRELFDLQLEVMKKYLAILTARMKGEHFL